MNNYGIKENFMHKIRNIYAKNSAGLSLFENSGERRKRIFITKNRQEGIIRRNLSKNKKVFLPKQKDSKSNFIAKKPFKLLPASYSYKRSARRRTLPDALPSY